MKTRKNIVRLLSMLVCYLSAAYVHGQNLESISTAKPFEIKGNLSARAIFFDVNGRDTYREPFTWLLQGSPTVYLYGIAIPINIVVSEQERDFRQPFNRFGISPEYKWAKLHVGYQNLQFSRYSLAGHAMVGAGVELNPGKLRFAYMRGQLLRAVQATPFIEDQDFRVLTSFKRTGDIVKIGYGTEDNYVDVIALKGRDIISSLDSIPDNLTPSENLVMSFVTRQTLFKKLRLDVEYAESYFTDDIRSESITGDGDVLRPFDLFFDERTSTRRSAAVNGSLQYQGDVFFGGVEYERIDPDYRSMGAYFFLNDIQRYTVTPGVKLFKNKVSIKTSYGYQENNLDQSKDQRTIRKISGAFITARFGDVYQFSGNYSNYGVEQRQVFEAADPALEIAQVTRQWSMNHTLSFQSETHMHNINLNINQQNLNDDNEFTKEFSDYTSSTYSANYMVSFLNSKLTANAGFTYSGFDVAQQDITFLGPNLGINKSFLENKLQLSFNGTYFVNQMDAETIREITRLTLRTSYRVNKSQRLSLRGQFGKNEFNEDPERSFEEIKMEISYGYRF
ncbi:MAG: hypothetical protein AAFX87_09325 [Bacteroidota bacterium]